MADAPKGNLRRYTKKARVCLKKGAGADRGQSGGRAKLNHSAAGFSKQASQMSDRRGRHVSPMVERNKLLREDLNVSGADNVSQMRSEYSKAKPRYMDCHAWKSDDSFCAHDQKAIVSKFLNMKNRLGLNYLRPEYEGMLQEKEDSKLELQDKKNKLVMEQHDLSMIRLQN